MRLVIGCDSAIEVRFFTRTCPAFSRSKRALCACSARATATPVLAQTAVGPSVCARPSTPRCTRLILKAKTQRVWIFGARRLAFVSVLALVLTMNRCPSIVWWLCGEGAEKNKHPRDKNYGRLAISTPLASAASYSTDTVSQVTYTHERDAVLKCVNLESSTRVGP